LLDAADENSGGADAGDIGGLVGSENSYPVARQFLFEFQRVVRVAAGPFDVFADHDRESRGGAGGFGQQVRDTAVTRQPGAGDRVMGAGLAAVLKVGAAGGHVAVDGDDVPACGQPLLA